MKQSVCIALALLAAVGCGQQAQNQPPAATPNPQATQPRATRPVMPDFDSMTVVEDPQTGFEVGMLAPEIEGEDLDGVPFKLSDYRGKVVVLDFWGHW